MYDFAEKLIEAGHAYVDSQTADEMRASRGTLTEPGKNSPFRDRTPGREPRPVPPHEGRRIRRRRAHAARQDRHGSGNINLRDPAIYRIRQATHHNTGDLVHLPDVHLRPPDRGRAGEHHPLDLHAGVRGPAPLLRLAAGAPGRTRLRQHAAAAADRIRPAQPPTSCSPSAS
jgi:hypothetical protein